MNMSRNPQIEKLYMEQLRNIETAVYYLFRKKGSIEKEIDRLKKPFEKIEDPGRLKQKNVVAMVAGDLFWGVLVMMGSFVVALPGVLLLRFLIYLFSDNSRENWLYVFLGENYGVVSVILALLFGGGTLAGLLYVGIRDRRCEMKHYEMIVENNQITNRRNAERMNKNFDVAKRLSTLLASVEAELKKALSIRAKLYSVNWLPNAYRNIQAAYYICDVICSSDFTIKEAIADFRQYEISNKLDMVLAKMDDIIDNQHQMILNQSIMQSRQQSVIDGQKRMIAELSSIEQNTQLAAEYAQIGAGYSAATAYFGLAQYLSK